MDVRTDPPALTDWLAVQRANVLTRFWSYVDKSGDCWLWTGTVDGFGYGRIRVGRVLPRAHRFSYELANGPVPDGLVVRHQCDVPNCVRPDHLELGTKLDNARDRDQRGRAGTVGEANRHAKLTEAQVREIRCRYTGARGEVKALCAEFGIKGPAFYAIVRRTGWKHVD